VDGQSEQADPPIGTIVASAIALIGFILIFIEAGSFGTAARLFPRVVATLGGVSAAVVLVQALLRLRLPQERIAEGSSLDTRDIAISYVVPIVYAAGMYVFGFWVASLVCLSGLMLLLGERRYMLVATITIGTLVAIYLVFEFGFSIRMPKGLILEALQG
jgi:hypothetical protein